jgi:hypothetical protein
LKLQLKLSRIRRIFAKGPQRMSVLKTPSRTSRTKPKLEIHKPPLQTGAGTFRFWNAVFGSYPAWVFAAAIFLSAGLLFFLEPMLAKMLLPRFGGAAAVWGACVVFFQTMLLAGYAYAHWLTTRLRPRHQVVLHLALLTACLAFLPIGIPDQMAPAIAEQPVMALLGILVLRAGLPFLIISATTPLLQRWLAASADLDSRDPYRNYAASNAGSLLALIAYPLLVEPSFSLPVQGGLWAGGFGVWLLLVAICATLVWRSNSAYSQVEIRNPKARIEHSDFCISNFTRAHWVLLAFVPTSLMLGCTSYLTEDVASVPLLWIIPLALYLLSFVFAFAGATPRWIHPAMVLAFPISLLALLVTEGSIHLGMIMAIHLTTLFLAAMVCHGELARRRPAAQRLTEYYLWIALGGALGSYFNALVAPLLFSWVVEYPLALCLAAFLLPPLFCNTPCFALSLGAYLSSWVAWWGLCFCPIGNSSSARRGWWPRREPSSASIASFAIAMKKLMR